MPYVRSASLRGFRETVDSLGGDPEHYARLSGLPLEALSSDDVLVEGPAAAAALELAARTHDCADLGLRMAALQGLATLGSLSVAVANSPTLGEALDCTTKYLFVHGRPLSLTLEPDPEDGVRTSALFYRPASTHGPRQAVELGIGLLHRNITSLHGGPYGLRSVRLPYEPAAPVRAYRDFFGVPVRFGAPEQAAVLRIPATLAQHRLTGVNDALRQMALDFLARQQQTDDGPITTSRVRSAITLAIGHGTIDLEGTANLLELHPRTLQRRLQDEGTSYDAVLDGVRRSRAAELLADGGLPLGQVSALVGFAEQSALSRAARRWWGASPSQVRRSGAPDPPVSPSDK